MTTEFKPGRKNQKPGLVSGVAAGDPKALQLLYDGIRRRCRLAASRLGGDDVIHDIYLATAAAISDRRLAEPNAIWAYVATIALRCQIRARRGAVSGYRFESLSSEPACHSMACRQRPGRPELALLRPACASLVHDLVKRLGHLDREIIDRYYGEGQTTTQICKELSLSPRAFYNRKMRALLRLRDEKLLCNLLA